MDRGGKYIINNILKFLRRQKENLLLHRLKINFNFTVSKYYLQHSPGTSIVALRRNMVLGTIIIITSSCTGVQQVLAQLM